MAWKEIDPGDPPPLGNFFNFKSIGERFAGVFVSVREVDNNFGKKQNRYSFKNKEGNWDIDANFDLDRRLQAAKLKPGFKVLIQYVKDIPNQDPTKSSMRSFKVMVDDDLTAHTPPPGGAPPPRPKVDEDVPF